MSKQINPDERRSALQGVLAYPPIVESPTLHHFLEFLGEKALRGESEHLKEYEIATQVFRKAKSFDPRMDPIVRVHARRLREKVDQYYEGPGRTDHIRIEIPKGSYLLQFSRHRFRPRIPISAFRWVSLALLALLLAQTVLWIHTVRRPEAARPMPDLPATPILAPFLKSPAHVVVTFSNDIFLKDRDGNLLRVKPDQRLDLSNRISLNPHDLLASPYLRDKGPFYVAADYTGTGDAMCVHLLTRFFTERGQRLDFLPSSLLSLQEVRDENVIFVGSTRENVILAKMNVALNMRFVRKNTPANRPFMAIENLRPRPGEKALYEARLSPATGNPEEEYALISYLPGLTPTSHILILAGESTAGTQCACEYAVDPALKRELPPSWSRPEQLPPAYQILLKTSVRDFGPYHTEFVTYHLGTQPEPPGSPAPHP